MLSCTGGSFQGHLVGRFSIYFVRGRRSRQRFGHCGSKINLLRWTAPKRVSFSVFDPEYWADYGEADVHSHHVDQARRFSAAMHHDVIPLKRRCNLLPERGPLAGRIENESVIEYPMAMRSILLRCLVVLVALAFVGGTPVNARTQSMSLGAERLSNHDAADAGTSVKNSAQHHKVHACLCCCLGCASFANRAPDCTLGAVPVSATVSYGERITALAGRILHPDPYPPRLSI